MTLDTWTVTLYATCAASLAASITCAFYGLYWARRGDAALAALDLASAAAWGLLGALYALVIAHDAWSIWQVNIWWARPLILTIAVLSTSQRIVWRRRRKHEEREFLRFMEGSS